MEKIPTRTRLFEPHGLVIAHAWRRTVKGARVLWLDMRPIPEIEKLVHRRRAHRCHAVILVDGWYCIKVRGRSEL